MPRFFLIICVMTVVNLFSQQNPPLIFGHRGCRGILPENTLESFKKALTYDIDGIEWDVVVNKDKQLVISHEEYMDKTYCLAPDGSEIKHNKDHCLYEMTQKEIEAFDCGTKPHPKFPEQQHIKSYKPLVQEAFNKIDFKDKTILFEIKSEKKLYGKAQPYPEEYVEIILNEVAEFKGREQIIFMSFDPQIIELLHQKAPDYKLVYLHESLGLSGNKILKQLSFKPYALGIYSKFISPKMVKNTHEQGVKVFAWTVNKEKEFNRLLETNLDGIITDFPNLYGR